MYCVASRSHRACSTRNSWWLTMFERRGRTRRAREWQLSLKTRSSSEARAEGQGFVPEVPPACSVAQNAGDSRPTDNPVPPKPSSVNRASDATLAGRPRRRDGSLPPPSPHFNWVSPVRDPCLAGPSPTPSRVAPQRKRGCRPKTPGAPY